MCWRMCVVVALAWGLGACASGESTLPGPGAGAGQDMASGRDLGAQGVDMHMSSGDMGEGPVDMGEGPVDMGEGPVDMGAAADMGMMSGEDMGAASLMIRADALPYAEQVGDQRAWVHRDEAFTYGVFHTFDALKVCGEADSPRKAHVFLPWGVFEGSRRYPVVYMNDGDTAFWGDGFSGKTWGVGGTLSTLASEGAIQEVIVVALLPLVRDREYTHTAWFDGRECCGVDGYASYLKGCVKPFIDAHYPTQPGPRSTAIVGSSHGGLAAFYTATRHPETFGYAGALSPSLWVGLDYGRVANPNAALRGSALMTGIEATLTDANTRPRIWLDWGLRRDGGDHNAITEALVTTRAAELIGILEGDYGYTSGDDLFTHEDPVGGHDEDAWRYRFGLMMRAFFPTSR